MTVIHAPFNGYCHRLNCYFGAIVDPSTDTYVAVQVYRDGNPIPLASFSTEEAAELHAAAVRDRLLQNLGGYDCE